MSSAESITSVMSPDEILGNLPPGSHTYTDSYQPKYSDQEALREAIHEVHSTTPVTTSEQVDALGHEFYQIVTGKSTRPVVLTGRCAEPVDINIPISTLADNQEAEVETVQKIMPGALDPGRGNGQNTKPRSSATEVRDGITYASYMGDAVNGQNLDQREPDPSRMVAAAVQARDLSAEMKDRLGRHRYAAHEALLVPYELGMMHRTADGRKYLLSADLPWIGVRTNDPDGYHVDMLSGIENPVGVKIGPDSTQEHIEALKTRLNPEGIPGKLVFMLRAGHDKLDGITQAVAAVAPESLTMYDIHGVTRTAEDEAGKIHKIRAVPEIIKDIHTTAESLGRAGLRLHGVHLETIADNSRLECVDYPDQFPTHPGGVDPQLNLRQLAIVLKETKHLLIK